MPLTQRQIDIIGEALRAAAYGPFFPETEYSAIFGIEKEEVALVAEEWPVVVKATCLLYTSPSPRDKRQSRMPSSA